jgi:hypothetical protein
MNKLLLASILVLPTITLAASDVNVNQTQSAIDQHGRCKTFATTDEISDSWKLVDSCEKYAPVKKGASPEEVLERRWKRRLNSRSANTEKKEKKPVLGRRRIGSGTLTRGGADRVKSLGETKRAKRTTTNQKSGTTKQFLLQDSRRLTKNKKEWARRRNARSGIKSGSATQMERTGKLSGKFWSTESGRRTKRLESQETTNGWKEYLSNRQKVSTTYKRREKKPYVYKGISLRRMYRGERLEGDMEN